MTLVKNLFTKESWIGKFVEYTSTLPTPAIFRKWAAISCVMGALERRVYVKTANTTLFPNHYILLIAPPGVGKSMVIDEVRKMWIAAKVLKIGPDAATKAAMVDSLNDAMRHYMFNNERFDMRALQVASPEFGNLISEYTNETMNFYNKMWDCPNYHQERLRYGDAKNVVLEHVQLNLIAGTQPAYLGTILPKEAWGMGYTARLMMVYADKTFRPKLFPEESEDRSKELAELETGIKHIVTLCGEMKFSAAAKAFLEEWYALDNSDGPEHLKLESYKVRRPVTIQKISMAICAGSGAFPQIEEEHLQTALSMMLEAERFMPEIFKGMVVQEDSQVMSELHNYAIARYAKTKAPLPECMIVDFIRDRVAIHKIDPILKHMLSSGLLKEASSTDGGSFTTAKRYLPGRKG